MRHRSFRTLAPSSTIFQEESLLGKEGTGGKLKNGGSAFVFVVGALLLSLGEGRGGGI